MKPNLEDTFLYDEIPSDRLEQVRRCAYDIAWGALHGYWDNFFIRSLKRDGELNLGKYLKDVWGQVNDIYLVPEILEAFGYLAKSTRGGDTFEITEKAFLLLEKPRPLSIFISYRRQISSALAMLIWSELRVDGFKPFLDIRDINTGDIWHGMLETKVRESNVFIVILGQSMLLEAEKGETQYKHIRSSDSEIVLQEIK